MSRSKQKKNLDFDDSEGSMDAKFFTKNYNAGDDDDEDELFARAGQAEASASSLSFAPKKSMYRKGERNHTVKRSNDVKKNALEEDHLEKQRKEAIRAVIRGKKIFSNKRAIALPGEFLETFKKDGPPVHPKTDNQQQLLQDAARKNFVLKDLVTKGTKKDVRSLISAFETVSAGKGEIIDDTNNTGRTMYVIEKGKVEFHDKAGKVIGTASGKGTTFGELNMLFTSGSDDDKSSPTIVAAGRDENDSSSSSMDLDSSGNSKKDETKLLKIDHDTFRGIMQTSEMVQKSVKEAEEMNQLDLDIGLPKWLMNNKELAKRQHIRDIILKEAPNVSDLNQLEVLGEGQFGEVWLVDINSNEVNDKFALKQQSKTDELREDDAEDFIKLEIEAMENLEHPFIAFLLHSYESEESLDMLLGLIPGGELWDIVHKENDETGEWISGLQSEKDAIFYAMIVADTLGFIHDQSYIFRDLKPENIMINHKGYPIIVDFGFAKKLKKDGEYTFTFCGTPNYVAPEIISNTGHNAGVDWWAFGVLVYEMISGENPFAYDGIEQTELYDGIVNEAYYGLDEEKYSKNARDIIDKLLEKPIPKRLGMIVGNGHTSSSTEVLKHPWFSKSEYKLSKMRAQKYKAPYIPGGGGDDDSDSEDEYEETGGAGSGGRGGKAVQEEEEHPVEDMRAKAKAEALKKKAEEEARRKAEEEAKRKAEEEARRKAEEELRKKREEELRKKREEEARIKAEAEAKRKAEEEAKRKAEEEARKKREEAERKRREEEARIKAEAEAKRKAEEEARRKAEEERRLEQERIAEEKRLEREAKEKARREALEAKRAKEREEKRKRDEAERKKKEAEDAKRRAIEEEERRRRAKEDGYKDADEAARRARAKGMKSRVKVEKDATYNLGTRGWSSPMKKK